MVYGRGFTFTKAVSELILRLLCNEFQRANKTKLLIQVIVCEHERPPACQGRRHLSGNSVCVPDS